MTEIVPLASTRSRSYHLLRQNAPDRIAGGFNGESFPCLVWDAEVRRTRRNDKSS